MTTVAHWLGVALIAFSGLIVVLQWHAAIAVHRSNVSKPTKERRSYSMVPPVYHLLTYIGWRLSGSEYGFACLMVVLLDYTVWACIAGIFLLARYGLRLLIRCWLP